MRRSLPFLSAHSNHVRGRLHQPARTRRRTHMHTDTRTRTHTHTRAHAHMHAHTRHESPDGERWCKNAGERERDGWRGYPESRCMKLCCLLSGFDCRAITCQEDTRKQQRASTHTHRTRRQRAHTQAHMRGHARTPSAHIRTGPRQYGPEQQHARGRERVKHTRALASRLNI